MQSVASNPAWIAPRRLPACRRLGRSLAGLAVLTVAAFAGCRSASQPAGRAPGAVLRPAHEYRVKEATLAKGMISVSVSIPVGPVTPRPTVIALIGDPRLLVGAGFVAVTYKINWKLLKRPSPKAQPQTVGKWVLASPTAERLGEGYLRDIAVTATEYVPALIDWLETLPDVDAERIGMAGGSTNGFVTLQAVSADPRIRAAVAIAACGDYRLFLRDSTMGMSGKPLQLESAYGNWIDEQEIVHHPDAVVHAALLMINRVGDELIPVSCADETARILSAAFAAAGASERFQYLRLESTGHGVGADESRATFDWLRRWLQ